MNRSPLHGAVPASDVLRRRVLSRLLWLKGVQDPVVEPRNLDPRLPELRRWQMERLGRSFAVFLANQRTRPAAEFFLSDLYGDHDFSDRDRDVARVLPKMMGILPAKMIVTAADGIELAALSHALDVRMAEVLSGSLRRDTPIDASNYAEAYRSVGLPHLRLHQIGLIECIGTALDHAVHTPTLWQLLKLSRLPARLAGLDALQSFLERGFGAFRVLGGAEDFVGSIVVQETEVLRRLFARDPDPFGLASGSRR